MIWSIVHKPEMADGTEPIFRYYKEALGKDNVSLAIVEEDDCLDFVKPDDVVLVRTMNEKLWKTISEKDARNTLESRLAYRLSNDKAALSLLLDAHGILVPMMYDPMIAQDGKTYFVKPRFGSDSKGIDEGSICRTKSEVERRVLLLGADCMAEDFIEGVDCTVACWVEKGTVQTCAIQIECDGVDGGIQTFDNKLHINEFCSAIHDQDLEKTAKEIFALMDLKHYARIDFRRDKNGDYFLIDVNLMPGFGPLAHFPKCLSLGRNFSYRDTIMLFVNTATKSQKL